MQRNTRLSMPHLGEYTLKHYGRYFDIIRGYETTELGLGLSSTRPINLGHYHTASTYTLSYYVG